MRAGSLTSRPFQMSVGCLCKCSCCLTAVVDARPYDVRHVSAYHSKTTKHGIYVLASLVCLTEPRPQGSDFYDGLPVSRPRDSVLLGNRARGGFQKHVTFLG